MLLLPSRADGGARLAKVAMTTKKARRNAVGVSPDTGEAGDDRFLNALQVRARYGKISEMTLWRWVNERGIGFPQPTKLANGRNFWRLSQLRAWERSREAALKDQETAKASIAGNYVLAAIDYALEVSAPIWGPKIFPNGRISADRKELRCANIHGAAPKVRGSCRIWLTGPKAGEWYDFSLSRG